MLDKPGEAPRPYVPLHLRDVGEMLKGTTPTRAWCVPGLIPHKDVTLFAGDGGGGKTTLALQLAHARATGWAWLGRDVTQGATVYYGAEDDVDELHFRLKQITDQVLAGPMELGDFTVISVADDDAELAIADRDHGVRPTPRFADLENCVNDCEATLLILDAAADVFGGDEIKRREVRSFIRLLRGLAIRRECAVLLLSHPSAEGMRSGTGTSGSTHWSNAVRSRLYLSTPTADGGAEIDPDLRELTLKKSNRARRGDSIVMRYRDGMFVAEDRVTASDAMRRGHARAVFLELLDMLNRQGRTVSANVSSTYAPAVLAREPGAKGVSKQALAWAMSELLKDGKIVVQTVGRPGKERTQLCIATEVRDAA